MYYKYLKISTNVQVGLNIIQRRKLFWYVQIKWNMDQYSLLYFLYNGMYDKFAGPTSMNQLDVHELHNGPQYAVQNYLRFIAFSYSDLHLMFLQFKIFPILNVQFH